MTKYCGALFKVVLFQLENLPEILNKPAEWSTSEAVKAEYEPSSQTVASADLSPGSVAVGLEPAQESLQARCLWCGRAFNPRSTGGSAQKFCGSGHRQQFWIAARRWTMRAIEAGLLSVDCLKASQTSVHAAGGAVPVAEIPLGSGPRVGRPGPLSAAVGTKPLSFAKTAKGYAATF
jgi:hypothetical protein